MTDLQRKAELQRLMDDMPSSWRERWCEAAGGCACLGCANGSGGLIRAGFSKADWEEWRKAKDQP